MTAKDLVLMDAGLFCSGMRVRAPIYYLYKGAYVLLCRDVVLTDALIQKLYRMAKETSGVYIKEDSYEEIWNESLRQYSRDSAEYESAYEQIRRDYNQVLSKTVSFLGEIAPKHRIPLRLADEIVDDIANELYHQDQSLMLNCINMISETDNYLYTHSVNVAALNGLIGRWMKLPEAEVKRLMKVGLVHDLGKLKIPPNILNKPGKLTEAEFAEIKHHPVFSHEMLLQAGEGNKDILDGVRQHHEKSNGTGYPDGVNQPQISQFARITAVSDVYDAMVSKRCYKKANTPFEVLAQFQENRFSDLDLEIVNLFLENIAFLFVGMRVKLSNGELGEVVFVPPSDYSSPVVRVGRRVFGTGEQCKCIEAESELWVDA